MYSCSLQERVYFEVRFSNGLLVVIDANIFKGYLVHSSHIFLNIKGDTGYSTRHVLLYHMYYQNRYMEVQKHGNFIPRFSDVLFSFLISRRFIDLIQLWWEPQFNIYGTFSWYKYFRNLKIYFLNSIKATCWNSLFHVITCIFQLFWL